MAVKGIGSKFYYGNTGAEAATQIARVRGITPPTAEVPDIDTSHLESTAREFTAGLRDNGEAELSVEFAKTAIDTLEGLVGTDKAFKIELADGSKFLWEGYIKSLGTEPIELDTIVVNTITVKVSGAITFTPAA